VVAAGVLLVVSLASAAAPRAAETRQALEGRRAYERAIALEADGNHAAALSLLWAAAGAAPRDAEIQNRLGEALDRLGALDAAIDGFERALAVRPAFHRARNNLVIALGKAGRGAEGVRRAEAWVAAAPDDPDGRFTLALAAAEQDVELAVASLRQVIAARPRHGLAHLNLARLLKRLDRVGEATAAAERAVAIDARPEAGLALGALLFQQGRLDAALAAYDAVLDANPRIAEAWLQRGTVLRARGDLRAAAEAMRRAVALEPGAWGARAALATVLSAAGDSIGARQASGEAERLREAERLERAAVTMTTVGIARLERGDLAGALERFTSATGIAATYAPAHYHLGRTLVRLGRDAEARRSFARARQLNPSLVAPDTR
jgi:tetratricopeptide (TPR) repeat protein